MSRTLFPHGIQALIAAYGTPWPYVDHKRDWEDLILVGRRFPRALPYAYGKIEVQTFRAHRKVADVFVEAFAKCLEAGVPPTRLVFGGIYCWRPQVGGIKLSTHTWGIALDVDPARNPRGKAWEDDGRMLHPTIVQVFTGLGFTWGNDFRTPDPMHWQAVSGY